MPCKSKGLSDWYKYTLRSIALFAGQQVKFSQVTIDWLKRYEKHLLNELRQRVKTRANIAFISESLGHNDLKTTENYLASF